MMDPYLRCVGIVVLLLGVWATPAVAAALDGRSEHVALRAFDRYLDKELLDVPAGRGKDDAFVASISARCPNVLAAYARLPSSAFSATARAAFGEEAGLDMLVVANAPNLVPFAEMKEALSELQWSGNRMRGTVKRFLVAQHALLLLAPSDLCADANELAANPQATPPGTRRWLATFGRDSVAEAPALAAFLKILYQSRTAADAAVIKDVVRVLNRLSLADGALTEAVGPKLLAALGDLA